MPSIFIPSIFVGAMFMPECDMDMQDDEQPPQASAVAAEPAPIAADARTIDRVFNMRILQKAELRNGGRVDSL